MTSKPHSESRWFHEYGWIGPEDHEEVIVAAEIVGFEFVYGGATKEPTEWQGYPAEYERLKEQLQALETQLAGAEGGWEAAGRLKEQFQVERRDEWREGIVNVLDHEGNYLGCMGSETWAWTLGGGIESMKEQLEALHKAAVDAEALLTQGTGDEHCAYALGTLRKALSNPASEPLPRHAGVAIRSTASSPAREA